MKIFRSGDQQRSESPGRWVVLSDGARPTEDLYFFSCVSGPFREQLALDAGRVDTRSRWQAKYFRPHRLFGANILICRSLPEVWIELLESHRAKVAQIVYLFDDDFAAGARSDDLPSAYRERLGRIMREQWSRLLNLADEVVVTSRALASRFSDAHKNISLLEPPMIFPAAGTEHFDSQEFVCSFHGTRAHARDLLHIATAIECILDSNKSVRLRSALGRFTPARLRAADRVDCVEPMSWSRFKKYLVRQRIHVGLVPLLDTPFNGGKSYVKFLEIAAMGGVGIFSRRPPYVDIVEHGVDGLLVDDNPASWVDVIQGLVEDRSKVRRMAEAAAAKAIDLGNPEIVRSFWSKRSTTR